MEEMSSTPHGRVNARSRTLVLGLASAAIVVALAAGVVVISQVEVTDTTVGVTRTCGSVFDSVADRSGWETWWARDLDEPDAAVRAALVRTTRCPDAINLRIAIAATLAGLAAAIALFVLAVTSRRPRPPGGAGPGDRMVRLGRITSLAGATLTAAGLVALVVLVADADSTLFLYADRLVVGVIGLIVLVPTVALVVIGRALVILGGADLRDSEPEADDA